MQDKIKAAFPVIEDNACLIVSTENNIFIQDQLNDKCIIVDNSKVYHFFINNIDNNSVSFLAIDKCMFDDQSGHKKCDFAFYTNTVFAFVEIKDTANRQSGHKTQAKEQLEATIVKFREKIDFENVKLLAIISWKYRPLRPAASTGMQSAKFNFLTKYNVDLREGNKSII